MGSTKTSTAPPHESPISTASSVPRSMSTSRGSPPARTASAASITRASMQPPMVTDPRRRPSPPTHIFAPSLRGVVPRVSTSVASATRASRPSSWVS
jgi:hypothetical protein